jgi:hypothetical protein
LRFTSSTSRIWLFIKPAYICVLAVAAMTVFADSGRACSFHFYQPALTAIDRIIGSDPIVLARNSASEPFRYSVVQTLSGKTGEVPIPQLVDSATRRRLQQDPASGVIFAFDDGKNSWISLGFADPAFQDLVNQILTQRARWGTGYHPERFAIAEALQDHRERRLRELALQELDRTPYAMLRTVNLRLRSDDLLDDLWAIRNLPYMPIRVLLLGISGEEAARAEIHHRIRTWADAASASYLGVYATALIEIDGADGIAMLDRIYSAPGSNQSDENLAAVIEALAIHSISGSTSRKLQIREVLTAFLQHRPDAVLMVASQFAKRQEGNQSLPPFVTPPAGQTSPTGDCCSAYK